MPVSLLPIPPIDPFKNLGDLARLAGAAQWFDAKTLGLRAAKREETSRARIDRALAATQGQLEGAIAWLDQQGFWQEAAQLRQNQSAMQAKELEARSARNRFAGEQLALGAQIVRPLLELERPDEIRRAYAAVHPKLLQMFPGVEGMGLPEPEADPLTTIAPWLRQAHEQGLSSSEAAKIRSDAEARASRALTDAKTQAELDKELVASLVPYLQTVNTPEEYARLRTETQALRLSPHLKARLPATWSPELANDLPALLGAALKEAEKATQRVTTRDAAGRETTRFFTPTEVAGRSFVSEPPPRESLSGSETARLVQAVMASPKLFTSLTPTRRDQIVIPLQRAGFDFRAVTDQLTGPERRRYERDRLNAIGRIRAAKAKDPFAATDPASAAQYDQQREDLEAAYDVLLGRSEASPEPEGPFPLGTIVPRAPMGGPAGPPMIVVPPSGPPSVPAPPTSVREMAPPAAGARPERTGVDSGLRLKVKELLRANGFPDTESNVDRFLADPMNRQKLGLQ